MDQISTQRIQSLEAEASNLVQEWNCRRLWAAVLKQAIMDLEATPERGNSRPWERRDHATIDFFDIKNESFVQICKVVGFEPTEIIERVRGSNDINQIIDEISEVQEPEEEISMKEGCIHKWKEACLGSSLSPSARILGLFLAKYYVPSRLTFPKQITLETDAHLSESTVRKATEELVRSGLIITRKAKSPGQSYDKIVYFFKEVNDHLIPQFEKLGFNLYDSSPTDPTGAKSTGENSSVDFTPTNSTYDSSSSDSTGAKKTYDSSSVNSTPVNLTDKYTLSKNKSLERDLTVDLTGVKSTGEKHDNWTLSMMDDPDVIKIWNQTQKPITYLEGSFKKFLNHIKLKLINIQTREELLTRWDTWSINEIIPQKGLIKTEPAKKVAETEHEKKMARLGSFNYRRKQGIGRHHEPEKRKELEDYEAIHGPVDWVNFDEWDARYGSKTNQK